MEDVVSGRRLSRRWLLVGLCIIFICIASSIPGNLLPYTGPAHLDKIVHAVEFALLGFFLMRAVVMSRVKRGFASSPGVLVFFVVWMAVSAFGGLDEIRQMFAVGRDASGYDFIADSLGALIGVGAGALFGGIS